MPKISPEAKAEAKVAAKELYTAAKTKLEAAITTAGELATIFSIARENGVKLPSGGNNGSKAFSAKNSLINLLVSGDGCTVNGKRVAGVKAVKKAA